MGFTTEVFTEIHEDFFKARLILRSYFPLSVAIFCFLKKKAKGFPLLSGLGELFSEEILRFPEDKRKIELVCDFLKSK